MMQKNSFKANLLNSIKVNAPRRNFFDLSKLHLTSMNMGDLIPVLVHECVPGDTYTIGCDALVRLQALISPVMHKLDVRIEYFFVPNRIIFEKWPQFITNKEVVAQPTLTLNQLGYDTWPLIDYLGLPRYSNNLSTMPVNALPFAAYQMIWNDYYRDQNLQAEVNYKLVPGTNSTNLELYQLRKRAWQHDRFTAALPFAQKGPAVDIPLGNIEATDVYVNKSNTGVDVTGTPVGGGTGFIAIESEANPDIDPDHLYVPEMSVGATTINELRIAEAMQRYFELFGRGGSRYDEMIKNFFGVLPQDSRLNRPEYIVGVKSPIIISEVLNTSGQVNEEGEPIGPPQGNMAGHGVQMIDGNYAQYSCFEHGYIIAMASVLPETMYQQGVPKTYLRTDPTDYYTPQFDHIGEEEVLNVELYVDHPQPNGTFGYTPRNSDYKVAVNTVSGDFKTTLAHWHFGRIFETPPNLNAAFIASTPTKRPFAVETLDEDCVLMQIHHRINAKRPMSRYSTPI